MPYTINLTNGNLLTIIPDDTVDTTTSLELLGRSFVGYGGIIAENFVYLLENFANDTAPSSPLPGQLWYNSNTNVLNLYSGSSWAPVGGTSTGITITETTADNSGLLFYDPAAPTNSKYYRIRVRDDGGYDGHLVIESLNDNNTINTVVFDTDNVGDVAVPNLTVAGDTALNNLDVSGTATAVTQADSDNSTKLATTFYVRRTSRFKTGGLNMYVSPSGNDSNDGLTSGTPMLLAQHAVDTAYNNYDFQAGANLTINYAAGTYDQLTTVYAPLPGYNFGTVIFNGNTSSPASVVFAPSTPGAAFNATGGGRIWVKGMTIGNPHGSSSIGSIPGNCIVATLNGVATATNVIFGATQRSHVECGSGGYFVGRTYTIAGGAQFHIISGVGCTTDVSSTTITLTGTPAFSLYFAWAATGYCYFVNTVFSGSATGARYLAADGGVFATNGAGTSYLPGNSAGDSTTGYYT